MKVRYICLRVLFSAAVLLLTLAAVAHAASPSDQVAWRKAQKANNAAAYERFIRRHPQSQFLPLAKAKLKTWIEPAFAKASKRGLAAMDLFARCYPVHDMPVAFQQKVEARFVVLVLASTADHHLAIDTFKGVAGRDARFIKTRGRTTFFEAPTSDVVGFKLEYPGDMQPFGRRGPEPPTGHGTVWRFRGKVDNILGVNFHGDKKEILHFVLVDGRGLVYLFGRGEVTLRGGSKVTLPQPEPPAAQRPAKKK